MQMDYQQSRAYIRESEKYGSVLGLENMRELMKRLGNPQNELKFVHVAGTNGKGSVITYLYSVLSEAGYRVGRYISPTIYSYRERMECAGEAVSREKFADCITRIADAITQMTAEGFAHPTPFEIETAAAFLYFKDEKCDLVLLEVGMGGDLDATNIILAPELAILVSISMDHTSFLGNTLYEIAQKKAGIIKKGCSMITVKQKEDVEKAIREACLDTLVHYEEADARKATTISEGVEGQVFWYEGEEYQITLSGVYQKENAVLALNALRILDEKGFTSTLEQRKKGLRKAKWGGRFTIINKEPLFIVDGAHNPAAADKLQESIETYFKGKRIIYIMGVFRDKDYRYVIEKTHAYADKILTIATPDNPRALPARELAETIQEYHENVEAADSLEAAVEKAFAIAKKEDIILAFGSLSFIGRMTELVETRGDK